MNVKTVCVLLAGLCGSGSFASAYDLHEWGTFTTLSGSDGVLLTGMQVEEERLPYFVQGHAGLGGFGFKGMMRPVRNVTVKMETPVIYYYGDQREKVSVEVGFHGGTISQWYPPRTGGDTPPKMKALERSKVDSVGGAGVRPVAFRAGLPMELSGYEALDFGAGYEGAIHWEAEIIPRDKVDSSLYFRSGETLNWIYPKVPDSNIVKVGNVYEEYLFYRGLGNFSLPVTLTVNAEETLKISYEGDESVPFALAYEMDGTVVRYKVLKDGLGAKSNITIADRGGWTELKRGMSADGEIYRVMRDGLISQGLTADEADGMVKTWWTSYFQHDGLRVFWVLPQGEVERVLPMKVSPEPESKVRVIVGRSEVLRPRFEKKLLEMSEKKKSLFNAGRYGVSYGERVKQLQSKR